MTKDELLHIIKKAKVGNQSAFSQLLDLHWDEVYYYMLNYCKDENIAEDITIQTFEKAFEKLDSYNAQYGFNTWLITIAKNLFIDQTRKKTLHIIDLKNKEDQQNKLTNIIDESRNIEDQIIYEQNLAKLHRYIKQIPLHYSELIQLRFFQEKSYKEIATIKKEPLNTIKVKLLRAKKLLIEMIKKSE